MNLNKFTNNLASILKILEDTKLSANLRSYNFTASEFAQIQQSFMQIATQTALNLEELELKDRQLALEEEKVRQELELSSLNAKAQNKTQLAEALKSLIQAHSMAISLAHNAQINRANAYVGFLNVVGNASNNAAIANHANNAIKAIDAINLDELKTYDNPFGILKEQIEALIKSGTGNKEVFIYAPKMLLEVGEPMRVLGVSSYGNNPCKFLYNGQEILSKNLVVSKDSVGSVEVEFKAQNQTGKWESDSLKIEVVDSKIKEDKCF